MIPPDNRAVYIGLIVLAWVGIDLIHLNDPALIDVLKSLLTALGVYHLTRSTPGE